MAKSQGEKSCRLNRVGGQAVIEGVMMKAGERTVTTCRKEDGTLVVNDSSFVSVRKKHKILNIPILRGVVNFVEMMMLSFKTLNASADALGIEEEEGKAEKWLKKHLGIGITDVIMVLGGALGILLSLFLFMFLPTATADGINWLYKTLSGNADMHPSVVAVIEGAMKVIIFISYIALVGLLPDIKRTFMYHGAEHKSIACFEAGDELTPENAKKHKRFHPRCGTSFMFLMITLGIIAGMFVRNIWPGLPSWAYALIRLGILPLVMGVGYEVLMLAGKHDNIITRIISAPGIWMQRLTTKEPTEDMLEVAIISIKCALRDDFPEFMEFWREKPWLKSTDASETTADDEEKNDTVLEIEATDTETGAIADGAVVETDGIEATDAETSATADSTVVEIDGIEAANTEAKGTDKDGATQ